MMPLLQKSQLRAVSAPLSPSLHCVFSCSGHWGVKGHAESAQAIRLMHQVLTFCSRRRMANILRHFPSFNTNPIWKLLDIIPLLDTVFLKGNHCVIKIQPTHTGKIWFSKHLLDTWCVLSILKHSRKIHRAMYDEQWIAIRESIWLRNRNREYNEWDASYKGKLSGSYAGWEGFLERQRRTSDKWH